MADDVGKVGEAYVELRYKADPNAAADAEKILERDLNPAAARAGEKFGTVLGKGIGLALNPKVQAAAGAASGLLLKFASDQKAAAERLDASIQQSGRSVGAFTKDIEAAVKAGEHLGQDQGKTKGQLAELTLALGDPAKALTELSTAQDIAAGTGRSFTSVVNLLRQAQAGSSSAYEQLGVKTLDLAKAQQALTTASKQNESATDKVRTAQRSYTDQLQIYRDTLTPTLSQQIALKNSHDRLVEAQHKSAASAAEVRKAQADVNAATRSTRDGVQQLTDKYKGQASAGSDTFIGKLKGIGAQARDTAGDLANSLGGAVTTVGPVLFGLGATVGGVRDVFLALRTAQVTGAAEGAAATVAGSATTVAALEAEAVAAGGTATALGAVATAAKLGIAGLVAFEAYRLQQSTNKGNDFFAQNLKRFQTAQGLGLLSKKDQDLLKNRLIGSDADFKRFREGLVDIPGLDAALAGTDSSRADSPQGDKAFQTLRQTAATAGKKTGKTLGEQTLAEYLKSINGGGVASSKNSVAGGLSQAILDGQQRAVDAVKTVMAGIQQAYNDAKSKLQQTINEALSFRDSVKNNLTSGSSILDALSGIDISTDGGKPISREFQIDNFLRARLAKLRTFAAELETLRKKGLNQALINQIAQAGPDGGAVAAAGLVNANRTQIARVNSLTGTIGGVADRTAASLERATYGRSIAVQEHQTAVLAHKLDQQTAVLKKIEAGNAAARRAASTTRLPGETTAQAQARALRATTFSLAG